MDSEWYSFNYYLYTIEQWALQTWVCCSYEYMYDSAQVDKSNSCQFSTANIRNIPVIRATRRPSNQRLGENKPVAILSCRERSLIWTRKSSQKMPKSCEAVSRSTHNRQWGEKVSFYTFPQRHKSPERRNRWIQAVKKLGRDGTVWSPSKHLVLCSKHFVTGVISILPGTRVNDLANE